MTKTALACACLVLALVAGCESKPPQSPDVKDSVRAALDGRGYKDVSVSQDREKGVVTLTGKVASDADKAAAAVVAQGLAGGQVVANQIVVEPPGMEADAKKIRSALDDGIDSNVKALFVRLKGAEKVKYDVQAGVVTLTGTVASQLQRTELEKAVKDVPNVAQVVNEVQVTNQKATSRGGL